MTPRERQALAEQLAANPLTADILGEIERNATEALIYASTETSRIEAQWRVRAARAFRSEFEAALQTNRGGKGAPV